MLVNAPREKKHKEVNNFCEALGWWEDISVTENDQAQWLWHLWHPNCLESCSDLWNQQDTDRHAQSAGEGQMKRKHRCQWREKQAVMMTQTLTQTLTQTQKCWQNEYRCSRRDVERWEDTGKTESTATLQWPQRQQAKGCEVKELQYTDSWAYTDCWWMLSS